MEIPSIMPVSGLKTRPSVSGGLIRNTYLDPIEEDLEVAKSGYRNNDVTFVNPTTDCLE